MPPPTSPAPRSTSTAAGPRPTVASARRNDAAPPRRRLAPLESSLCQELGWPGCWGASVRPVAGGRRVGRSVVTGPGVTDPKSRLLWGVRPVTLDLRAVPALSSRARDVGGGHGGLGGGTGCLVAGVGGEVVGEGGAGGVVSGGGGGLCGGGGGPRVRLCVRS